MVSRYTGNVLADSTPNCKLLLFKYPIPELCICSELLVSFRGVTVRVKTMYTAEAEIPRVYGNFS